MTVQKVLVESVGLIPEQTQKPFEVVMNTLKCSHHIRSGLVCTCVYSYCTSCFYTQSSVVTDRQAGEGGLQKGSSDPVTGSSQHSIMSDIDYQSATKASLAATSVLQSNMVRSTGNIAALRKSKLDLGTGVEGSEPTGQALPVSERVGENETAEQPSGIEGDGHQQGQYQDPQDGDRMQANVCEEVFVTKAVSSGVLYTCTEYMY